MLNQDSNGEAEERHKETIDPVLAMLGVGAELWQDESGDRFVRRLRADDVCPVNTDGESL
jgi:hypothetical protein